MDKPYRRRRPNPLVYLFLGIVWVVLGLTQWNATGSTGSAAAFALLGVANLGLAVHLRRKQRAEVGPGVRADPTGP